MSNLLTKEVAGTPFSPLDAVLVAGSKIATEALLAKVGFIGNGTVKSGLIKMGMAFALTSVSKGRNNVLGKATGIIGTGLMVDGGEDLVRGLLGSKLSTGSSTSVVGGQNSNQGVVSSSTI